MRSFLAAVALAMLGGCAAWQPKFDPNDLNDARPVADPLVVRDAEDGLRKTRALRTLTESAASNRRDATFYASEVAFYGSLIAGIGVSTESIAATNTGGGAALLATLVPGRYQLPKQREAFSKAAERAACLEQKLVEAGVWEDGQAPKPGGVKAAIGAVAPPPVPTPLDTAHANLLAGLNVAATTHTTLVKRAAPVLGGVPAAPLVAASTQDIQDARESLDQANAAVQTFETDKTTLVSATTEALRLIVQKLQASLDAVELSGLTRDQVVKLIAEAEKKKDQATTSARSVAALQQSGEDAAKTAAIAGALSGFSAESQLCSGL
ncbi:hypothetical protein DFR29_12814 [Tahibacter aquaticus]|uniref:Lipoprotein n=1 Tax=Tahibacter aquaticus TaxID=520092 RepID=A0A4R6YIM0_9GAMM|nr:hypothetical protein [Tahibacter aquaticus]TDR36593.1 hypothetical protein DFR29_12814 [Tahibacter aquaticus]